MWETAPSEVTIQDFRFEAFYFRHLKEHTNVCNNGVFFSCIILVQPRWPIEFKFSQACYFMHLLRYTKCKYWPLTILLPNVTIGLNARQKQQIVIQLLKAVATFGNCQRPVFSLAVSQHMHKITNLWKFELNRSSK